MPDTNNGPAGTATDTAPSSLDSDPMAGFAEAMTGFGPPDPTQGEPERATAVETSESVEAPEPEAEKPEAVKKPEAPAKVEEKPDVSKTVNFDGLSDESTTFWENALKAGHATPADVERARKESLFQASWTRNHQKLAKEREAFQAEMETRREDLKLLDRIRGDNRLHDAWLKMSKGDVAADESDAGDLVDDKKAADIARKVIEAREAEKAERTAKENRDYESKKGEFKSAVQEQMRILDLKPDVMRAYLEAEEEALEGADPILTLSPTELMNRVARRHEKASLEAKVSALEAQLSQRASKAAQASKQSLPPARRVADAGVSTPLTKTETDLGLDQGWSNVQGFGFRDGR